jgi:moderate conductance mechanosensitive channel
MEQLILESLASLGWEHIPKWAVLLISSLNLILIIVLAFVVRRVVGHLLNAIHVRLRKRMAGVEERKRVDTLNRIFGYVASVVIWVITVMVILAELGISIAPFLATAGVVGIAISFGAQSLVKDYFTGFVMLIENQIRQGDFVDVAGKSGNVEEVTLRYVRLRDGEGTVHFVPNSAITTVSNHSRDFAYAVVEIGVGYDVNLGQAYEVIKQVGTELRQDPEFESKILDDIQILGVNALGDSAVTIRIRLKVVALEQWVVRRAILAALKQAFQKSGIEIPFPQRVVRIQNQSQPQ